MSKASRGTRVEVHRLFEDAAQAEFMQVAWAVVLGRLKAGVVAASGPAAPSRPRPRRAKGARD